jgi:hypothetical protein
MGAAANAGRLCRPAVARHQSSDIGICRPRWRGMLLPDDKRVDRTGMKEMAG